MATSRQNFFQAHWDWLVALAGLVTLGTTGAYLVLSLGQSPESAAAAYETRLNAVSPLHEGVDPVDLAVLKKATGLVKTPPSLKGVDSKRGNFLASERRVFCQKGDEASKEKACGRPIPADLEVCPYCNMKQHVVKVEVDSDGDGIPNDWEKKHGFNPNDPADAGQDADGDGFTNLEEFAAKTDPRDPKSHPDYLDSLAVAGELQQTFMPFWFKSYSQIPSGYRYYFQLLDKNGEDLKGYNATISALEGEQVGKSGFHVGAFKKQSELRAIAGSKTGAKKSLDVSVLELARKADGKKIPITIGVRKIPVETQVELAYERGAASWKKTVSAGTELDLNGEKYLVRKLNAGAKGCEVTVENAKTKKQKVIR